MHFRSVHILGCRTDRRIYLIFSIRAFTSAPYPEIILKFLKNLCHRDSVCWGDFPCQDVWNLGDEFNVESLFAGALLKFQHNSGLQIRDIGTCPHRRHVGPNQDKRVIIKSQCVRVCLCVCVYGYMFTNTYECLCTYLLLSLLVHLFLFYSFFLCFLAVTCFGCC